LATFHADDIMKPGWLYAFADAGKKRGPIQGLLNSIKPPWCQTYDVTMDEDSIRRRKRCQRNPFIDQTEKLIIMCRQSGDIPDKKRKFFPGTNRGQTWGYVVLDTFDRVWQIPHAVKKEAYGSAMRLVGGPSEEGDVEEGVSVVREIEAAVNAKPDTAVPFCWHGWPKQFFKELLQVNNVGAVLDFTPGDGNFAMAALEEEGKTLYLGFCHTERHCVLLRDHLTDMVMKAMLEQGNNLYESEFVKQLKKCKECPDSRKNKPPEQPAKKPRHTTSVAGDSVAAASSRTSKKQKKEVKKRSKKKKRGKREEPESEGSKDEEGASSSSVAAS
jgi:hypothetical protein